MFMFHRYVVPVEVVKPITEIFCLSVEFLPRSGLGDGPLAAFGGPDGVIRVLSMQNWLVHTIPIFFRMLCE
jgi:hypothetical protein